MHFTFARDARALAAASHVLVIAPKACFGPRARGAMALRTLLGKQEGELAQQLGAEASPGSASRAAHASAGDESRGCPESSGGRASAG